MAGQYEPMKCQQGEESCFYCNYFYVVNAMTITNNNKNVMNRISMMNVGYAAKVLPSNTYVRSPHDP